VDRWNFVFYAIFAAAMTLSIHIFGVLLAFSYLLLPATAALLLSGRVRHIFLLTPALAVACTTIGFYVSFRLDFPTGPFIATLMAVLVLVAKAASALR
jgi:ABC-type Mn2+/Zn2+ transport system permease subunit